MIAQMRRADKQEKHNDIVSEAYRKLFAGEQLNGTERYILKNKIMKVE